MAVETITQFVTQVNGETSWFIEFMQSGGGIFLGSVIGLTGSIIGGVIAYKTTVALKKADHDKEILEIKAGYFEELFNILYSLLNHSERVFFLAMDKKIEEIENFMNDQVNVENAVRLNFISSAFFPEFKYFILKVQSIKLQLVIFIDTMLELRRSNTGHDVLLAKMDVWRKSISDEYRILLEDLLSKKDSYVISFEKAEK